MLLTFFLAVFGWIIFRAENIRQAWDFICGICDKSLCSIPLLINRYFYIPLLACLLLMIIIEWTNRNKSHSLDLSSVNAKIIKYLIYFALITLIILFTPPTPSSFIYFQF